MAGSIQITQDSIVKILVRRGTDSERKLTTLTEGELGYTIDSQRLFIGDGITLGGVPAGNKFLGSVAAKSTYNSVAQAGDTIYQTGGGNEADTMWAFQGGTGWVDVHPKPYTDNLEKSTDGKWRVASLFVGGDSDEITPSGLTVSYSDTPYTPQSITNKYNRLDFDSRYMSLCADTIDPFYNSSFYFGNINNRKVSNNLNAVVNIDNSLYLNGRQSSNPYQVQFYATDPLDDDASSIKNTYGNFIISGKDRLSLMVNSQEAYRSYYSGSTITTEFSSREDGTYGSPNFIFRGTPLFTNPVFFDSSADVTILGNLSVYGDASYFETTVSTTSALSVINNNPNYDALVVAQFNDSGAFPDQAIVRVQEAAYPFRLLSIKERQYIGFNVAGSETFDTYNAHIVASGSAMFTLHPSVLNGTFTINHHDINILGKGTVRIGAHPSGNLYLSAGSLGYVQVDGGLYATGDVIAFFSSDISYKDNIKAIDTPLDKIKKLSGINFTWNDTSPYKGEDVGVIAQEVEKVLPSAVTTRGDGKKAVRYEKIIPLLIEAIKELSDKK